MKKHRLLALLLCGVMVLGLAGCKQNDDTPAEPTPPVESQTPERPDNFVDNSDGLGDIPDEQRYDLDGTAGLVLGVRDERVFLGSDGFATRFATNLLSGDPESDGSKGLPLAWIWDRVDYIQLADKQYKLSDLVRPRSEGFQVLEMLARDFGVTVYTADPETGALTGAEHKGSLSGDELREAYSERQDMDDYTVCAYYLDARMSGMDAENQSKARGILESEHGVDSDQVLDGTLAVMLYYDTDGYDMYYNVAMIAPGYFQDAKDFENNMNANARHDITKCHMMVDGTTAIGFVNQVFIRCDTDTVPDHTIDPPESGSGSRIEDGAPDGAEQNPTGNPDADKPGEMNPVPQPSGQDEAPSENGTGQEPAGESSEPAGGRNTSGAQSGN